MTNYYMQHRGSEINKIMCLDGFHADIVPTPETKADKVKIITKDEYALLKACNSDMDRLISMSKHIVELVNG